jgi:hypothetical protein
VNARTQSMDTHALEIQEAQQELNTAVAKGTGVRQGVDQDK